MCGQLQPFEMFQVQSVLDLELTLDVSTDFRFSLRNSSLGFHRGLNFVQIGRSFL